MTQKFVNNFRATVAQTFGAADQYLYLNTVDGLPVLGVDDYLLLTLFRQTGAEEFGHEVVKVTAITDLMLTVERGYEGAAPSIFNVGARVEARLTAKTLKDISVIRVIKVSNYTATANDFLYCDTSSGSFTVTLPTSPATLDTVTICAGPSAYNNPLNIARNGHTIMGLAEDMTINTNNATVVLVYVNTTWRIA